MKSGPLGSELLGTTIQKLKSYGDWYQVVPISGLSAKLLILIVIYLNLQYPSTASVGQRSQFGHKLVAFRGRISASISKQNERFVYTRAQFRNLKSGHLGSELLGTTREAIKI